MVTYLSIIGFLSLLYLSHAKYVPSPLSQYLQPFPSLFPPPPQPQYLQPPQPQYLPLPQSQYLQPPQPQPIPAPPSDEIDFLFNVMRILDPSTMGMSWVTNSFKLVDAVPTCYSQHRNTLDGLRQRVLGQPTRCFPQPVDQLVEHISAAFMKTMKAYVKLTDFMDKYNGKNDIFALLQFAAEEKQLAMEILDDVNFIVNSSSGFLGSPNCVVDEAVDVYGEYQGKFNDALYCLQDHVTQKPMNFGFK